MERREEIPHVETRTDTRGRKQPRKPKRIKSPAEKTAIAVQKQANDVIGKLPNSWDAAPEAAEQAERIPLQPSDDAEASAEKRKAHYAATEPSDCDGPADFWQRSLSNMAGDAISLTAFWGS
jgi:hypothetical protein